MPSFRVCCPPQKGVRTPLLKEKKSKPEEQKMIDGENSLFHAQRAQAEPQQLHHHHNPIDNEFLTAALKGDYEGIIKALNKGANVDAAKNNGDNALILTLYSYNGDNGHNVLKIFEKLLPLSSELTQWSFSEMLLKSPHGGEWQSKLSSYN